MAKPNRKNGKPKNARPPHPVREVSLAHKTQAPKTSKKNAVLSDFQKKASPLLREALQELKRLRESEQRKRVVFNPKTLESYELKVKKLKHKAIKLVKDDLRGRTLEIERTTKERASRVRPGQSVTVQDVSVKETRNGTVRHVRVKEEGNPSYGRPRQNIALLTEIQNGEKTTYRLGKKDTGKTFVGKSGRKKK